MSLFLIIANSSILKDRDQSRSLDHRPAIPCRGHDSRANSCWLDPFGSAQAHASPMPSAGFGALPDRTLSSMRWPTAGSMLFQYSKARASTGLRTPPSRAPATVSTSASRCATAAYFAAQCGCFPSRLRMSFRGDHRGDHQVSTANTGLSANSMPRTHSSSVFL